MVIQLRDLFYLTECLVQINFVGMIELYLLDRIHEETGVIDGGLWVKHLGINILSRGIISTYQNIILIMRVIGL